MNYEDMTNSEITKIVSKLIGLEFECRTSMIDNYSYPNPPKNGFHEGIYIVDRGRHKADYVEFEPCLVINHVLDIISDNEILVRCESASPPIWSATRYSDTRFIEDSISVTDENPARAASICFIKIKESEL